MFEYRRGTDSTPLLGDVPPIKTTVEDVVKQDELNTSYVSLRFEKNVKVTVRRPLSMESPATDTPRSVRMSTEGVQVQTS